MFGTRRKKEKKLKTLINGISSSVKAWSDLLYLENESLLPLDIDSW